MPTKEQVMEILKNVYDPEIMINVVDLGLVYGAEIQEKNITVKMTLTTVACPMGPAMAQDVITWCKKLEGIEDAKVEWVFDPPWNPNTMMSEEARLMFGFAI